LAWVPQQISICWTTEQSLVALDAAVASADATLVQVKLAVFQGLWAGGWRKEDRAAQTAGHRRKTGAGS